eukprot:GHUV01045336.1.p2 GENE.GHUV01045336.1~~GHUV01045336.1.p2  ORF type:complete len:124 (-),score=23.00 GHUV01045336.1:89-460(-)
MGFPNQHCCVLAASDAIACHVMQARSAVTKRLQVPNITGALPLVYNVYADLEILSGPATHSCTSTNRGDTYKLSITPLRSGNSWGSVSFVTEDGQYCWYSVEVSCGSTCALPTPMHLPGRPHK